MVLNFSSALTPLVTTPEMVQITDKPYDTQVAFDAAGLPTAVQHLAHLLIIAEVRSLICSGPPRGTEHTYVLADEVERRWKAGAP